MEKMKSANCGAGCDCNKPAGNTKIKATVCLVVLLGIGGIFVYKAYSAKHGMDGMDGQTEAAFASGAELIGTGEEAEVTTTQETGLVGRPLVSLAALNEVAANQDAVFVFIPAKGNEAVGKEATDAISSALQRIQSTGARIGLYTLQSDSPEYASIAAQLQTPGMLVMSKGRGMGGVSGGITETKILQAYVASSRVSGCGPAGCGPVGCP